MYIFPPKSVWLIFCMKLALLLPGPSWETHMPLKYARTSPIFMELPELIELARPHQYVKNIFILLPAFFAFKLHDPGVIWNAVWAFAAFSLLASSIYIFNDWNDRDEDRRHPQKCCRPIASGRVGTKAAFLSFALFLVSGLITAAWAVPEILYFLGTYFLLNIAYSLKLKHQSVIDVAIIAIGFVIRLFAGAAATGVVLSHWIIVMTFLLALFLALAKRRDDVLIQASTEQTPRKVIDGYNLKFLDASMVMTASIVILAYILWSMSSDVPEKFSNPNTYLTALFVVLGIMRYLQISLVEERSGNPTKILLKDTFLQLTLIGWVGSFVWILYL